MSVKYSTLNEDQRKNSVSSGRVVQQVSSKLVDRLLNIYIVIGQFIQFNFCRIVFSLGFILLLEFVLLSNGVAQFLTENVLGNYAKNSPKSAITMVVNETSTTVIVTSTTSTTPTTSTAKIDACNCNGENFCFKGLDEVGNVRFGLPFNCSLYEKLKSLQLLDSDAAKVKPDYKQIVADDNWSPVFVTCASSDHFSELRGFVKTIRTHYPKSKIVVFDIGLQPNEIEELWTWCLVEYWFFDFSKYPDHVKKLKNYSFKMANIEAFATYKTFFYFDSSVRITGKNLLTFLKGVQSGVLLPFSTHTFTWTHAFPGHSVYATTHPNMSAYLPLPLIVGQMDEFQSPHFLSDSPYTRYILKWWYLCAMTKDCIDPEGAQVICPVDRYRDYRRTYINCHRFDQSYWNIAGLAYLFGPERGAVQLNYTKGWDKLNENLIVEVNQNRQKAMEKFFKLLDVRRDDNINIVLKLPCQ